MKCDPDIHLLQILFKSELVADEHFVNEIKIIIILDFFKWTSL